jgi:hypothetical protein
MLFCKLATQLDQSQGNAFNLSMWDSFFILEVKIGQDHPSKISRRNYFLKELFFFSPDIYGVRSTHSPLLSTSITTVYMRKLMQTSGESDMPDRLLIST